MKPPNDDRAAQIRRRVFGHKRRVEADGPDDRRPGDPTPDEIRERAAAIRAAWPDPVARRVCLPRTISTEFLPDHFWR
jgi:hypothetical protein